MNKKDDFELFAYSITESYNNCKKFVNYSAIKLPSI